MKNFIRKPIWFFLTLLLLLLLIIDYSGSNYFVGKQPSNHKLHLGNVYMHSGNFFPPDQLSGVTTLEPDRAKVLLNALDPNRGYVVANQEIFLSKDDIEYIKNTTDTSGAFKGIFLRRGYTGETDSLFDIAWVDDGIKNASPDHRKYVSLNGKSCYCLPCCGEGLHGQGNDDRRQ